MVCRWSVDGRDSKAKLHELCIILCALLTEPAHDYAHLTYVYVSYKDKARNAQYSEHYSISIHHVSYFNNEYI